jgi:hypothetical protein
MLLNEAKAGQRVRLVHNGTEFTGTVIGPGEAIVSDANGDAVGTVEVRTGAGDIQFPETGVCQSNDTD